MKKILLATAATIALSNQAYAGGDLPPPPPAPVYQPSPAEMVLGGIVAIPVGVISGAIAIIAAPFMPLPPPCVDPQGFFVPCQPPVRAQRHSAYHPPSTPANVCYDEHWNYIGGDNPDCTG